MAVLTGRIKEARGECAFSGLCCAVHIRNYTMQQRDLVEEVY